MVACGFRCWNIFCTWCAQQTKLCNGGLLLLWRTCVHLMTSAPYSSRIVVRILWILWMNAACCEDKCVGESRNLWKCLRWIKGVILNVVDRDGSAIGDAECFCDPKTPAGWLPCSVYIGQESKCTVSYWCCTTSSYASGECGYEFFHLPHVCTWKLGMEGQLFVGEMVRWKFYIRYFCFFSCSL